MPKRGSMCRLPPPNSSSGSSRISARIIVPPPASALPGRALRAMLASGLGRLPRVCRGLRLDAVLGDEGEQVAGVDVCRRGVRVIGPWVIVVLVWHRVGWGGSLPPVVDPAVDRDGRQRAEQSYRRASLPAVGARPIAAQRILADLALRDVVAAGRFGVVDHLAVHGDRAGGCAVALSPVH